jgi:hypothetical protein
VTTIIAVDPGATGGIAAHEEGKDAEVHKMPETRRDTIDLLQQLARNPKDTVAYIEKINGYIPDGGPSQMFEFGKSVERVGCILETLGVRLIEITPQAWIKSLALGKMEKIPLPKPPKGLDKVGMSIWKQQNAENIKSVKAANQRLKTEWKNKLKSEAQRRFPSIKVTLGNCDALLILEAAKQSERNA